MEFLRNIVRTKEFKNLPPLERQGIQEIERCRFISRQDQMLILATYLGYKPYSEITIGEQASDIDAKERELESMLENLGLRFIKKREYYGNDTFRTNRRDWSHPGHRTEYLFGKEEIPAVAETYIERRNTSSSDESHREYGALMGIPATAIEAFIERSKLDSPGPRRDVVPSDMAEKQFLWFVPSEDHWQEELRPVTEFANKVKKISPMLHARIQRWWED